jgi:crossover junction endodeoxyribonuclease RuvC
LSIYVGLDLSLTGTGFAKKDGTKMDMQVIKTKPKDFDHDLARLQFIRDKLMSLIPDDTALVCIEDFFMPHNSLQIRAAISLVQLGTLVRVALLERGIPMRIVAPQSVKKFATGKGNAQKGIVIREVYKRWGIEAEDDNQADGFVLSCLAESAYILASGGEQPNLAKYQIEVVDKLIKNKKTAYNIRACDSK